MWLSLSVATKHVAVSAELMEVTISGLDVGVTILIVFTQVGISVAIMQVLLSAVHNCFYCKMQVTVSIITMQMTLSSNNFICLSFNWHPLFKKLTAKHLKAFYQVTFYLFSKYSPKIKIL